MNCADKEYPWSVDVPVNLAWNLTLYTGVQVNFFLDTKGIDSVSVNGRTLDIDKLPMYDEDTCIISLDVVAANKVMEPITVVVNYGGEFSVEKTCTLVDYAESVFKSNNSYTAKQLVAATMNYINSAYIYAYSIDEEAPEVPAVLTELLGSADYLKYATDKSVVLDGGCDIGNAEIAIHSAQLDLASELKFRFNLASDFTGTLVINDKEYTVINGIDSATGRTYINLGMRAYALYQDDIFISGVSADGEQFHGMYCFATYVNSIKDNCSKETLALMDALGAYVFTAYEYLTELNELEGFVASAEVVNKDGTDATVTYVVDDGGTETGITAKSFLEKYDYLKLSFGIYTQKFSTTTLKTEYNEDGELVYVMENGRYVYTLNNGFYQIWKDIMSLGKSEIISHSHTHAYWGQDDEGGVCYYVDKYGKVQQSSAMPKGSSSKEFYAPIQILSELFPESQYPLMKLVTFIIPGISVAMTDVTVDGVRYPSYYNYFTKIMKQAVADGDLIGARNTFQVNNTTDSKKQVVLPSYLINPDYRLSTPAYMILDSNKGANGIENWTAYIDHAIEQGGWACFCIHEIRDDKQGHYILKNDADALFAYVGDKNVWVATYTEAMLYYCEWSTASVSCEYRNGSVFVTLTDEERDDVFDMALTVKVSVPNTWNNASYNGETVEVQVNEDGSRYVYVNVVPDSGEIEIEKVD